MKKTNKIAALIILGIVVVIGIMIFFSGKKKSPEEFKVTEEELLAKIEAIEETEKVLVYLDFFDLHNMENKKLIEAYFDEEDGIETSYVIYAKCEFEEEEFRKEKKRLKEYCKEADGKKQSVIVTEEMFSDEASIAIWREYEAEYALFNPKNHTIQYVLTTGAVLDNGIIPKQALPNGTDEIAKNVKDGYNLFMFESEDGGYDYIE